MAFNGYRSWAQWNVALWLNNDEGLYRTMIRAYGWALFNNADVSDPA